VLDLPVRMKVLYHWLCISRMKSHPSGIFMFVIYPHIKPHVDGWLCPSNQVTDLNFLPHPCFSEIYNQSSQLKVHLKTHFAVCVKFS
jgi:hypothetical protein